MTAAQLLLKTIQRGGDMKTSTLVTAKILVVLCILFSLLLETEVCLAKPSAGPIDRFIGQLNVKKTLGAIGALGHHKGKLFILYHGDRVVIERNGRTGEVFLIGIYTMSLDPDLYPGINSECIVPVERVRIKNFTLNVDINDIDIKSCL